MILFIKHFISIDLFVCIYILSDLSYQNFSEYPDVLEDFHYLNSIYLSHNNVRSLPKAGVKLALLDLSYNNLRTIPEEMRKSSISMLMLNSNEITSIENVLPSMVSLNIASNYITEIPFRTAKMLPSKLNIDYNYIPCYKYTTSEVSYFKKNCDQDKQYTCTSKTISECDDLKNNYGICTPNSGRTKCLRYTSGVKDFCDFAADSGIEGCMDIYPEGFCNGTSVLHDFVYNCESDVITEYSPSDASTMLKDVPYSATKLTNLTTLKLIGLNLTAVPESYSNFAYVNTLNLTNNRFAEMPRPAYQYNSLTRMDISHNKLTALPYDFFASRSLKLFYAHHNYLMNISDETYKKMATVSYVNLDYNLLTCRESHSSRMCTPSRQFVCSEMDEEECNLEVVDKCIFNATRNKCVKYVPPHEGGGKSKKTSVAPILVPLLVVVIIVAIAFILVRYGNSIDKFFKKRKNKGLITDDNDEKHEKEKDSTYSKKEEYNPPKVAVVIASPTTPVPQASPTVSSYLIPTATRFTPIARARMDVAPSLYGLSQPGLNGILSLFASNEHMRRKDLLMVLQQAGCDPSESQKIIQEIVIWAGKIRCTSSFTTHDVEVLGVYTYDYGSNFRMKSPAFKLCYAMNIQDETEIRMHKDFLYLVLTSLRRLSFANFGNKKMYFTMTSMNASSANFPVGNEIKIMPFLTLFTNKNVALATLSGTSGVVFEVSAVEGYDVTQYSIVKPNSNGTSEIIMEPESVFRIEGYKQVSESVAEVSLMYIREKSEFPLANVIGNNNNNNNNSNGSNNNANYDPYYASPSVPSAPSAPSAPYGGPSAPSNLYY